MKDRERSIIRNVQNQIKNYVISTGRAPTIIYLGRSTFEELSLYLVSALSEDHISFLGLRVKFAEDNFHGPEVY